MGCCQAQPSSDISFSKNVDPELWSQTQVCQWLQSVCHGDLADLIPTFRYQQICGLSFVKLSAEHLQQFGVKQIGLREQFLYERDKVLTEYHNSLQIKLPLNCTQYHALIPSSSSHRIYVEQHTPQTMNSHLDVIEEQIYGHPSAREVEPSTPTTGSNKSAQFELLSDLDPESSSPKILIIRNAPTPGSIFEPDPEPDNVNNTGIRLFSPVTALRKEQELLIQRVVDDDEEEEEEEEEEEDIGATPDGEQEGNETVEPAANVALGEAMEVYQEPSQAIVGRSYYLECKLLFSGYMREAESLLHHRLVIPSAITSVSCMYYIDTEKHIAGIAKDCYRLMTQSDKHLMDGVELRDNVKRIISADQLGNVSQHEILSVCNDLVSHGYLELIITEQEPGMNVNSMENEFSPLCKYQFAKATHRNFVIETEPDRKAWTVGTAVEIYSQTFGQWHIGKVNRHDSNDHDILLVDYGAPHRPMRKYVHRFDSLTVRSTKKFVNDRKSWTNGTKIEIALSAPRNEETNIVWRPAAILQIFDNDDKERVMKVHYVEHNECGEPIECEKYFDIWSPKVRQFACIRFVQGAAVTIWSNGKGCWMNGYVKEIFTELDAVNVHYGRYEKLLSIHSDDIKLSL